MSRVGVVGLLMVAAAVLVSRRRVSRPARLWSALPFAGSAVDLAQRVRTSQGRDRALAELPLALDLLACALRAGQAPSSAAAVIAGAVGGDVGEALRAVARSSELGAPADVAWQPIGRLAGVAAVARTAVRTADSGTRLAEELAELAGELRARHAAAANARVRRAGVFVVLPLGLCFLPAFVLIGVVPIVIGVARSVLPQR